MFLQMFQANGGVPDGTPLTREEVVQVLVESTFDSFSAQDLVAMGEAWERHVAMMRAFEPVRFTGDVLFFTALRQRPEGTPSASAWAAHVDGRITDLHLDVTHHGLMDPRPVAQIARAVLDHLASRDRRDSATPAPRPENQMPRPGPLPYLRAVPSAATTVRRRLSSEPEGSPAVRTRTAVLAPRSRYEVILVSRWCRCPLRGRHRTPVTPS
ncbi:hypothetical protein AQI95_22795 [Streptomyces yokosukanensis]|uniref:Uncharacterized protein n=1 Tax=Streptomyces yokosukanensis TaxID=67386 RepID=A0A101P1S9_9ACTN|nr:hypothetical protein [Streptomyces yokosukanensis]KUN03347.1 hypothetical protein AQI95_22795 [Streptomyces yokosukanensis]